MRARAYQCAAGAVYCGPCASIAYRYRVLGPARYPGHGSGSRPHVRCSAAGACYRLRWRDRSECVRRWVVRNRLVEDSRRGGCTLRRSRWRQAWMRREFARLWRCSCDAEPASTPPEAVGRRFLESGPTWARKRAGLGWLRAASPDIRLRRRMPGASFGCSRSAAGKRPLGYGALSAVGIL